MTTAIRLAALLSLTLFAPSSANFGWLFQFDNPPSQHYYELEFDFSTDVSYFVREGVPIRRPSETYIPGEHPDFVETNETFTRDYTRTESDSPGKVKGRFASDFLAKAGHGPVRVKFGLIDGIDGNDPLLSPIGIPELGRIGLNLKKGNGTDDFKNVFFENTKQLTCSYMNCNEWTCSGITSCGGYILTDKIKENITVALAPNNQDQWVVQASGWSFGKFSSKRPLRLRLSNNVDFISVGQSEYRAFAAELKPVNQSDGRQRVDCVQYFAGKPIEFDFGGRKVVVKSTDYVKFERGECYLRLRPGGSRTEWHVGAPFIDSNGICLDYDASKVTFFTLKSSEGLNLQLADEAKDPHVQIRTHNRY